MKQLLLLHTMLASCTQVVEANLHAANCPTDAHSSTLEIQYNLTRMNPVYKKPLLLTVPTAGTDFFIMIIQQID